MPINGNCANSCQQLLQDELQQPLRRWDSCQGEEQSAPHLALLAQNTGPWPQSSSGNIIHIFLPLQQPLSEEHSIKMKTCLSSLPNPFGINFTQLTCRFVLLQNIFYDEEVVGGGIFPSSPNSLPPPAFVSLGFTFSNICYHQPASSCFSTLQTHPLAFICHSSNNAIWNLHCIPYPLHPFNIITDISYKSIDLYYFSYSLIFKYHSKTPPHQLTVHCLMLFHLPKRTLHFFYRVQSMGLALLSSS